MSICADCGAEFPDDAMYAICFGCRDNRRRPTATPQKSIRERREELQRDIEKSSLAKLKALEKASRDELMEKLSPHDTPFCRGALEALDKIGFIVSANVDAKEDPRKLMLHVLNSIEDIKRQYK